MRINTNVSALNALRQLSITDGRMQGSINKLSTGLRINSAADDPAGLAISEGFRSQIKGLQQAMRNSQDAINMAKTAEGSLDEVSRLVNSIRSLAVHSANSAVIDSNQLQANQTTLRNALDSIDRIAEQTSWGTKKLLNGSAGATASLTRTDLVQSFYIGSEAGGKVVRNGPLDIQQVTAATQTTTGAMAGTFADGNATVNEGTMIINGTAIRSFPGDTISTVLARINEKSAEIGATARLTGSGPFQVELVANKYGANFPINFSESTSILNGGASLTGTPGANAVYDVTIPVEPSGTVTETFTGGVSALEDGLTLTSPSGNKMVLTTGGNSESASVQIGALSVGTMRFQIGANAEQTAHFSMPAVFANKLGTGAVAGKSLRDIDLTTPQGAQEAIQIIDSAVQELALTRGNLGAFQANYLESTYRSLAVAEENLTASESNIRDVDMAREMTEFTKVQILRQSGMAVLAQANQSSQGVLSLLQG